MSFVAGKTSYFNLISVKACDYEADQYSVCIYISF